MKRLLAALSGLTLLVASCSKDKTGGELTARPVALTVTAEYSAATGITGLPKEGVTVKIVNLSNGQTNQTTTNASGAAVFSSITPGKYTITATVTIPAALYSSLSQTKVETDVVFNGNLTAVNITEENNNLKTELTAGRLGNWVIKQIYYAGSNTSRGAAFRDQFLEIYNNSNEVMYADSLYIGQVHGVNNVSNNASKPGYLPTNQYDWSVAFGMKDKTNANTGYVYLKSMFMVPGTGKEHPVKPGESIVFAQTGLNHAAPYVMADGVVQGITDPSLTIDLSRSDFECYLVDYDRMRSLAAGKPFSAYKWDIDNPAVPNIKVVFHLQGNDFVLDNRGYDALVLFQPQGENPAQWPAYQIPTIQSQGDVYSSCPQVPLKHIIDAIELQHLNTVSRVPKRLPNSLDAGPVNVTSGAYTGESLVRKTVRVTGGRRVLQDTNNSANDFVTKAKADPSKSATSFIN
ncbi:DUF4876 domain-containing protein [Chitinophaga solisilvae]|uniref:DUF4876 domain-containing protein n=1 Tax=Chitinophaga solisilvae TaxID=1233460 RepID=A0A3S1CVP7_9BACT|nr:DUF4876 domain-containing protein [Chitinophaga solisilvae]NSL88286.1 DUF4876 domain-containing protein [Chitinophaga solisilvae]